MKKGKFKKGQVVWAVVVCLPLDNASDIIYTQLVLHIAIGDFSWLGNTLDGEHTYAVEEVNCFETETDVKRRLIHLTLTS